MPITSVHPCYADNVERWQRCRDTYEGEDAIKAAGDKYLPKLGGQESDEYDAYKKRALFYEAVGRSIDGFVGAIARKPPDFTLPAAMEPFIADTTSAGIGLVEFIKKLACEDLLTGRLGILVDYDEKAKRSYLSVYMAESITNWGENFVVLKERQHVRDGDDFALKAIDQYRELRLLDGIYTIRIWQKREGGTAGDSGEWYAAQTIIPQKLGNGLPEIPFFWLSCYGRSEKIEKPPLLGLVNVALSHYRSSADLENGRHFTGLPTLYITGLSDTGQPIRIGSKAAIVLADPTAKVGYAEFSGQGLGSLEKALESKENMMAVLGGMVFGNQKKGVEFAETARIRTSGETSLLMGVVNAIEEVLVAALKAAADWMNADSSSITVKINRDFVDTTLDPQTLTALLKAYLSNAIDLETFLFNLRQAEMLDPERPLEEIMAGLPKQAAIQNKTEEVID